MKKVTLVLMLIALATLAWRWTTVPTPAVNPSTKVVPDPRWASFFDSLAEDWGQTKIPRTEGGGR